MAMTNGLPASSWLDRLRSSSIRTTYKPRHMEESQGKDAPNVFPQRQPDQPVARYATVSPQGQGEQSFAQNAAVTMQGQSEQSNTLTHVVIPQPQPEPSYAQNSVGMMPAKPGQCVIRDTTAVPKIQSERLVARDIRNEKTQPPSPNHGAYNDAPDAPERESNETLRIQQPFHSFTPRDPDIEHKDLPSTPQGDESSSPDRQPNAVNSKPSENVVSASAAGRMAGWKNRFRRPVASPSRDKKAKVKRGEGRHAGNFSIEKYNDDTDVEILSQTNHSTHPSRTSPGESVNQEEAMQSPNATPIKMEDLSKDSCIIAVMGPTGAGKSSFIRMATGGDAEGIQVGHQLESCTVSIQSVQLRHLNMDVVFVDTPGFDDTHRSDVEILEMIADWLKKTYERHITLAGILYFHRISDNRMAGSPLKNLHMFKQLCGTSALKNIILTTTMWDEVPPDVGSQREGELKDNYWKPLIDQGSKTRRYTNTYTSAWEIVDTALHSKHEAIILQLQEELVVERKKLPETSAGRELYSKLERLLEKQKETLQRIREETRASDRDPVMLKALRDEYEEQQKELTKTMDEMHQLQIPLGTRLRRFLTSSIFTRRR